MLVIIKIVDIIYELALMFSFYHIVHVCTGFLDSVRASDIFLIFLRLVLITPSKADVM